MHTNYKRSRGHITYLSSSSYWIKNGFTDNIYYMYIVFTHNFSWNFIWHLALWKHSMNFLDQQIIHITPTFWFFRCLTRVGSVIIYVRDRLLSLYYLVSYSFWVGTQNGLTPYEIHMYVVKEVKLKINFKAIRV